MRTELRRFRRNPLEPLLEQIGLSPRWKHYVTEAGRCAYAYEFYYLSLARFLPEMSVLLRWRLGPYFALKYREPYTPNHAKIARRYHEIAPFVEVDLANCVIHAQILLDRVAPLSRRFLPNRGLLVRSFHTHRDFFQRLTQPFGSHQEYAAYLRERTGWFDDLKEIRDKFLVHAGPEHYRFFGIPSSDAESALVIRGRDKSGLAEWVTYFVSVPRLARDIDGFLRWFNDYGLRALSGKSEK